MKIVILGGTGDGQVVMETIRQREIIAGDICCVGFLNDSLPKGDLLNDLPVFGRLDDWQELPPEIHFIPALHKMGQMRARSRIIQSLGIPSERWRNVIHPSAVIASDVVMGYGNYVGAHVVIQPGSVLENFVSLRAGANLGHDAKVSMFSYIGPNAVLCGGACIGVGSHIAPCAVVDNSVSVGDFSIIAAAAVAARNVPEFSLFAGNPGRIISRLREED